MDNHKRYISLAWVLLFPIYLFGQDIFRVNLYPVKSSAELTTRYLTRAFVTRVIDGDTVQVRIEAPPPLLHVIERVRFLGVDTPETVDSRKAVQEYGEAAYLFTKRSIEKSYIFLAFDWDLRDQYGRILAYVYVENGLCFNTILLQRGYAYAYTRYPFQFLDEFKAHEMAARNNKVGLWR